MAGVGDVRSSSVTAEAAPAFNDWIDLFSTVMAIQMLMLSVILLPTFCSRVGVAKLKISRIRTSS